MAYLPHRGALVFTENDIILVVQAWIQSTVENVAEGKLSPEEATGSKAAALGLLLLLGIEIRFSDGTTWKHPPSMESRSMLPPKDGKERLN